MKHRRKTASENVLEAVRNYYNDKESKRSIANEYGISFSFFRSCTAGYKEQCVFAFAEIPHKKYILRKHVNMQLRHIDNGEGSFIDIDA